MLRIYVTVNNFLVMSGRSHRFLGINSTFWKVNVSCSRIQHGDLSENRTPTSRSGVRRSTTRPPHLPLQFDSMSQCETKIIPKMKAPTVLECAPSEDIDQPDLRLCLTCPWYAIYTHVNISAQFDNFPPCTHQKLRTLCGK